MKILLAHISILQSSKIVTALNAIVGLLYTLLGIPLIILGNAQFKLIGIVYLFGPIFMAVFGFLGFCVVAALYNVLARQLGGIEVEIKMQPVAVNVPPIS